jgi:hypothetical protein
MSLVELAGVAILGDPDELWERAVLTSESRFVAAAMSSPAISQTNTLINSACVGRSLSAHAHEGAGLPSLGRSRDERPVY